ncbi:MAG TPA: redox-sensing transcriptional repressor Rex [Actinobacteria bacterium]|nr:redox-sensing transcriptional repressor Rex [Actinomycetota bacterium]
MPGPSAVLWDGDVLGGPRLASVRGRIPPTTISRLPIYLRCLAAASPGATFCSSEQLAEIAGVNSAQVRKDLSYLGSYGVRGVGYNIAELEAQIRRVLGLDREYPTVIVGAGNLGRALARYDGFADAGFRVVALFDVDPAKVGPGPAGIPILAMGELERVVRDEDVAIAILAVPASAAQGVAERLAEAGIRSILNFAPTVLRIGDGVEVRRVDLSTELQILTYHLRSRLLSESG